MSTNAQNSQDVFNEIHRSIYLSLEHDYREQLATTQQAAKSDHEQRKSALSRSERATEDVNVDTKAVQRKKNHEIKKNDSLGVAPKKPANTSELATVQALRLPAPALNQNRAQNIFAYEASDVSLVAILGEALSAQARSSSTLYSSFFQQATQSMQASASLIDPTVNAVEQNWQQQAAATSADATKSEGDGWINLGFGAVTLGVGLYGAYDERATSAKAAENETEDTEAAKKAAQNAEKAAAKAASPVEDAAASRPEAAAANNAANNAARAESRAAKVLVKKGDEASNLEKTIKSGGKKITSIAKCVYVGFTKAASSAATFQMLATGIAGVSVDNKQESIKASAQLNAGKFDAASKEGEMYSQYYTQGFNRTEDLRQGTQQNLDLSVNILKSGADTITNALNSHSV